MHIIVGLVFGGFVLWVWLSGHFLGRLMVFLGLGSVVFLAYLSSAPGYGFNVLTVGLFGSWAVASLPRWIIGAMYRNRVARP